MIRPRQRPWHVERLHERLKDDEVQRHLSDFGIAGGNSWQWTAEEVAAYNARTGQDFIAISCGAP